MPGDIEGWEHDTEKFFEAAARFEREVARLYSVFAEKLPEHREFWSELAEEEKQHAVWLESLPDLVLSDAAKQSKMLPTTREMKEGFDYVESKIIQIQMSEVDFQGALEIARLLEISYLEKDYSRMVSGASEAVQDLLSRLLADERAHSRKILEQVDG